jgi:hypothetical protein
MASRSDTMSTTWVAQEVRAATRACFAPVLVVARLIARLFGGRLGTGASGRSDPSEPFLAFLADRIGKVPVQRERRVLHQRIDPEMKPLHRFRP